MNMTYTIRKVFVDAAPNRLEQIIEDTKHPHYIVGKNLKKIKTVDGYCYAIVDEKSKLLETGINREITSQFEAEAYGVLKTVEWAIKNKLTEIKVFTDCQLLIDGILPKKDTNKTKTYMDLVNIKVNENNLNFKLELIIGKENLADWESRAITVKYSNNADYIAWNNSLGSKRKYVYN